MHARLAETMDYVEEKRKELLQSFAGVPADRLGRKPTDGAWSVAEILDHLGIVESGVARLIAKRPARRDKQDSAKKNRRNRCYLPSSSIAPGSTQ